MEVTQQPSRHKLQVRSRRMGWASRSTMPPALGTVLVLPVLLIWTTISTSIATGQGAAASSASGKESDYYRLVSIATSKAPTNSRSKFWKPDQQDNVTLEVSGIEVLPDGRVAVAIRKGEVLLLANADRVPNEKLKIHSFASGLHEPLGLLWRDNSFYTVQRSELTRLIDDDKDDVCDQYLTVAKGWGVTGNYHEYAYGPKVDRHGNFWLTLNIGMGIRGESQTSRLISHPTLKYSQAKWRGWGMVVTPHGKLKPMCAGMRSPSGIGANLAGDMFYTDQQGNWVGTNTVHHLREGAFYHHVDALASAALPGSPWQHADLKRPPDGLPFPQAARQFKMLRPPAVWLPYKKVGQSATDIMVDASNGKFGPFAGQLFIGEFTLASINRVYLEKVNGQYQGACFPFREGFASAVLRMAQAPDGSVYAGLSNRGWSSLGTASHGLQRLVWTGKTPLEIQTMRAEPDGFTLRFTKPVDPTTAAQVESYAMTSHTYLYQSKYGSDEILKRDLEIQSASVSADQREVRLVVDGLRPLFVHSLKATGVRSKQGEPLLHAEAFYTLNAIPNASQARP